MSIFKSSFSPTVQKQLEARQKAINNRIPQNLSYFNSRNAWIRLSSSVNVYKKGAPSPPTGLDLLDPNNYDYTLADKYILQGGILNSGQPRSGIGNFSNAYSNVGADGEPYRLGIRPMPGITGVDIKTKGAYGSLRSATVNFQCWDVRQLEDLELLYMRPGYTLLLEWGWTPYILTDPNDPNKDKYITTVDYTDIIKKDWTKEDLFKSQYARATDGKYKTEDGTDKIITGYQGNADSMFGFVKNYSWKARMDGGYDCTTELISIGEIIESLKVNYSPVDKIPDIAKYGLLSKNVGHFNADKIPEKKLKEYYMQNILAGLFFELRQSFGIATNRTIITGESSDASTFGSSDDKGHSFTLKDTTYESDYDMFGVTININGGEAASDKDEGLGKSDEQIYITLNSLCTLLNNYVLVSDTNSATKNVATANKINGGKSRPLSPLTTNEMSGSDLVPLLALAHPLQVSIDPTVCLIKSPIWYEGIKIETEKDTKGEPVVTFSHNLSNPGGFVDRIISIIAIKSSISDDGKELLAQVIKETIQGSSASRYGQGQINENVKEISKLYLEKFEDPTYKVSKPSDTDIAKFGLTINNADVGKTIKEIFTFNPSDLEEFLNDRAAADFNDAKVTDILTSEGVTIAKGDPVKEAREKIKEEEEDLAEAAGESAEGFKFLKELEKEYFEKIINKDGSEGELGIIGNIYVNINMLYNLCVNDNLQETDKKEKKEIAIYDYIKSVLKKISPAIGNVNNFDIFVNPDTNVAQIIDINYVDKLSADDAYANAFELQIHNLESIVRSYSLESKIFPEQMSIVAIAAQAGGGALGIDTTTLVAFNKSIRDRIIPIKDSPITPSTKPPGAAEIAAKIVTLKESLKILYIFGGDLDDNWYGGDRDFDVDDATKYQNALKDIISFFVELGKPKMKGKAILPTVLNIDMDGIGGIIIGNLFKTNTDILPKGYKNMETGSIKLGYIVTEIGHSLQGNDWVTKLAAQTIILEEPQGEGINFNDIVVTNEETKETEETTDKSKTKTIILGPDGKPKPKSKLVISAQVKKNLDAIEKEARAQGITNDFIIIALKSKIMGESGGIPMNEELNYSGTARRTTPLHGYNNGIEYMRSIFTSRIAKYTDDQIKVETKNVSGFADIVYGLKSGKIGIGFGNTKPGDAFLFRGRSFIQLTGRTNYTDSGRDLHNDATYFTKNPDIVNQMDNAIATTVWFIKRGLPGIAKQLRMDPKNPKTQLDANLLVMSVIAGSAKSRPGKGFFAGILKKVDEYSEQF